MMSQQEIKKWSLVSEEMPLPNREIELEDGSVRKTYMCEGRVSLPCKSEFFNGFPLVLTPRIKWRYHVSKDAVLNQTSNGKRVLDAFKEFGDSLTEAEKNQMFTEMDGYNSEEDCVHPYADVYRKMDFEKCNKCGKVLCEG